MKEKKQTAGTGSGLKHVLRPVQFFSMAVGTIIAGLRVGLACLIVTTICLIAPPTVADEGAPVTMPQAKFEVRFEPRVMIPMRDGVRLSTDFYFPEPAGKQLGTILIHTPYNKLHFQPAVTEPRIPEAGGYYSVAQMFASQGFVVAVQDKRGKFESEGLYGISKGDGPDIYDSIQWISKRDWSNGKVATYGCSYLGETQILAAPHKPPALVAQVPQAAGGGVGKAGGRYRFFGTWNGGAFEMVTAAGWFPTNGNQIFYKPPTNIRTEFINSTRKLVSIAPRIPEPDFNKVWWHLPLVEMMDVAGAPHVTPLWAEYVSRDMDAPIFDDIGYLNDTHTISAPALHVNSWFDYGVAETLFTFNFFREHATNARARENQFAIISPSDHCRSEFVNASYSVGELQLGDPRKDFWTIYVDWFDHWLYGRDNHVTDMPKLQYYLMGKNEWRSASDWPVPGTEFRKFYLHSEGNANSRFGDGKLSTEEPGELPADSFVYDPASPVPTLGGPVCCTGTPDAPAGAFDQREIEMRNDVLVYSSAPLENGLEVTGPISLTLNISSTTKDTDFTGKLIDVFPDGRALNIEEGILRARYREGQDKKVWLQKDNIYEIRIDLAATAYFFAPGHRVRLEVSSSNFPRFDRNLNTGGNNYDETIWLTTTNSVHHSSRYPSYLTLPVLND